MALSHKVNNYICDVVTLSSFVFRGLFFITFTTYTSTKLFLILAGSPRVQIEVWSLQLVGYLMHSSTMLGAIEAITELTGRQKVPPVWTQTGAVVGLEGGTANVTSIVDRMYAAGVPMAGKFVEFISVSCMFLLVGVCFVVFQ